MTFSTPRNGPKREDSFMTMHLRRHVACGDSFSVVLVQLSIGNCAVKALKLGAQLPRPRVYFCPLGGFILFFMKLWFLKSCKLDPWCVGDGILQQKEKTALDSGSNRKSYGILGSEDPSFEPRYLKTSFYSTKWAETRGQLHDDAPLETCSMWSFFHSGACVAIHP